MPKLYVVVPAYNEEETIGRVLSGVKKAAPEARVIVVDDGSRDKTGAAARKHGAEVCTHIINRGLGAALGTGIDCALQEGADIIVTFDADLQHDPRDITRMFSEIIQNKADVVIGSRFMKKEDLLRMPFIKKVGNSFLTAFTNIVSGTHITDSQSGLRAFNRKAAERLTIICDRYEVSSEIIAILGLNKFKIEEIPIKALYNKRSIAKGTNVYSGIQIATGIIAKILGLKK